MKIKKLTAAICAATIGVTALSLTACGGNDVTYKVFMPDGAPAISLAGLMNDGYDGAEFTVVQASTIAQRVSTGDADFAIMPINAAATLYNNGADIVMLSVNTHGNLYIIGDGESATCESLVGKRLGVIGQGQVPDLTLKMLCAEKGIELVVSAESVDGKIAVTYADDGPSLAPLIKQGKLDYGLLGEPAATTLSAKLEKKIVADIQQQWNDAFGGEYPQACLVAKRSVVKSDKRFVKKFINAVEAQDGWAAENAEAAVSAVSAHMAEGVQTSLDASTLTGEVIARCNIKTVKAEDCKDACATYFEKLSALKTALDKPVLAKVPDDGFYYKG